MARPDRAIPRGTASGPDGPVEPGHDGENSKLTHYPGLSPDTTGPYGPQSMINGS